MKSVFLIFGFQGSSSSFIKKDLFCGICADKLGWVVFVKSSTYCTVTWSVYRNKLTLLFPMLPFDPPHENIRKPRFSGGSKSNKGNKRVKTYNLSTYLTHWNPFPEEL